MPTVIECVARALAAIVLFAAAGLLGWALATRLVGSRDSVLRVAASLVGSAWVLTVVFHVLRPLGLFQPLTAVGAVLLLAGVVSYFFGTHLATDVTRDRTMLRRVWRLLRRSPRRFTAAFFFLFALMIGLRAVLLPPLGWDTLTYHGLRAALWIQTGQATFDQAPGTWEIYRQYFAGSEVLFAWALLPFRGDLVTGAVQAVHWAGAFVAVWAFGRALGLREPWGSTAATFVAFVPTLSLSVGSGYVEPYQLMCLLTGMAAAMRIQARARAPLALLAAASLGLAVAVKLPGAPLAAVALLAVMWALMRLPAPARHRAAWLAACLGLIAIPIIPWLLLSVQETGYPLSPLPLSLGGVRLGVTNEAMRWYLERPELKPLTLRGEWATLTTIFAGSGVSESLGALTLVPFLAFPIGLTALARRRPVSASVIALAALALTAFFYSLGFAVVRLGWAASSSRFLLPLVALVVPVSFAWAEAAPKRAQVYGAVLLAIAAYHALRYLPTGGGMRDAVALLGLVAAGALTVAIVGRFSRPTFVAAATLGIVVLALVGLQMHSWTARARYVGANFQLHPHPKYWTEAAELVDEPSRPRVIAVTAGPWQNADNWFTYYFLGRRLQNTLVYVPSSRDGTVPALRAVSGNVETPDKAAWIDRLVIRGVTEVMTFAPRSVEQGWMEATPGRFEPLSVGPDWALYRLRP